MLEKQLKQLDYTHNEIRVYLAVIASGKVRAGDLASRLKMHRTVMNRAIDVLLADQLITKAKQGNKGIVYIANDPERIIDKVEHQKNIAKNIVHDIKKSMTQLPNEVVIYYGEDGIIDATFRTLNAPKGSTVYILGAPASSQTSRFSIYWQQYHQRRIKKGIKFKILYDRTVDTRILDDRNKKELTKARYLPPELEMPFWFHIYYDTVLIMIPSGEDSITFSIRNKETAEGLKNYFDYLWKQGKTEIN